MVPIFLRIPDLNTGSQTASESFVNGVVVYSSSA
jgi:hypothetical protein